jgi:quercetin dioxygenase-like cupin family protein
MAIHHAAPGEIVDLGPLGAELARTTTSVLVKTSTFEVIRLVVPAGKDISNHTAPGDVTVQCLEGAVDFTTGGRTRRLTAGHMLYLAAGTLHALHGVEDASVLVNIVLS